MRCVALHEKFKVAKNYLQKNYCIFENGLRKSHTLESKMAFYCVEESALNVFKEIVIQNAKTKQE